MVLVEQERCGASMVVVTNPYPRSDRMPTDDGTIDRLCRVATTMHAVPKHPPAPLYPNELVTLAVVWARTGVGSRATITPCFPRCPRAPGCFACSPRIGRGPTPCWPIRPRWTSLLAWHGTHRMDA